jgi:nucleotide-binding universal stress UspA family protein
VDDANLFELATDGPAVIVVGIDGSPTSYRAGAYAAGLARRQRARLVVAFIVTLPALAGMAPGGIGAIEETVDQIADEVRSQVDAGAAYVGMKVEFIAKHGDPFHELSRVADEVRADAVVVGASTHAGHRLVGSLAVRLVRAGKWPVTVVP